MPIPSPIAIARTVVSSDTDPRRDGTGKPAGGHSRERRIALLATTLAGSVVTGVGGGYLIDRYYGTSPRWTVILCFLFLISGLYQLVKEASR